MKHVHRPCRLSTPHVDLCECGAILVIGSTEWLESTWEPPPLPPPPPPPPRSERPTTPLPLLRAEELARAGWDVRS